MTVDMMLLADTETTHDPNMASLQSLIDCFFMENDIRPDLRDVTKEDVEMWVKKLANLNVSAWHVLQ